MPQILLSVQMRDRSNLTRVTLKEEVTPGHAEKAAADLARRAAGMFKKQARELAMAASSGK